MNFNPIEGGFYGECCPAAGGSSIPQLPTDPATPTPESAWVRATEIQKAGSPIGLLLSLTYSTTICNYELRYRTLDGITVGVPLS